MWLDSAMTAVLAILAILIPASVTVVGYWMKSQSDSRLDEDRKQSKARLDQERDQNAARLEQDHREEQDRLRLDAAMRAATLFAPTDGAPASPAANASGLLALTQLGRADLAVALLVDLWSRGHHREAGESGPVAVARTDVSEGIGSSHPGPPACVSTETAILVINAALEAKDLPNAQLVAAELLCRNATRLDPSQSLHWPAAIDGGWISDLAKEAKLLIMEALILMTTHCPANENALRSLVVRLYGVWTEDPNERVRGCVGTLIRSLLPALGSLTYTEFLQGRQSVTLDQLQLAAQSASTNPDGFLDKLVRDNGAKLRHWSMACGTHDTSDSSPLGLATDSIQRQPALVA